jgi:hypothetical protein
MMTWETENPSFYTGAASVIWVLDYLHRIGATGVPEGFHPILSYIRTEEDSTP